MYIPIHLIRNYRYDGKSKIMLLLLSSISNHQHRQQTAAVRVSGFPLLHRVSVCVWCIIIIISPERKHKIHSAVEFIAEHANYN